jgi:hypothetical protein
MKSLYDDFSGFIHANFHTSKDWYEVDIPFSALTSTNQRTNSSWSVGKCRGALAFASRHDA